jgi:hypothetical protein
MAGNCTNECATCKISCRNEPPLGKACCSSYFYRIVFQGGNVEREGNCLLYICEARLEL